MIKKEVTKVWCRMYFNDNWERLKIEKRVKL